MVLFDECDVLKSKLTGAIKRVLLDHHYYLKGQPSKTASWLSSAFLHEEKQ